MIKLIYAETCGDRYAMIGPVRPPRLGMRGRIQNKNEGKEEIAMAIQNIFVVGAGLMGSGIAQNAIDRKSVV